MGKMIGRDEAQQKTCVCSACQATCPQGTQHCSTCGSRLSDATTHTSGVLPVASAYGQGFAPLTFAGPRTALEQGTILQGRYRIERVLGMGSFGRVYLATDTLDAHNPSVAVKELLDTQFNTPEDKREAIAWFKREVSTLLTLDHPGIPAIHAYWTAQRMAGPFYLAMDYVPGPTLDHILDNAGPVAWRQAVEWAICLCDTLDYLHSQTLPFIFRDVKLSNVIIDGRTNAPMLIDFGITRQLAAAGGTAIGTWGYVPYEQIIGNAEPQSDLYALGATLHALLTGRRPDAEFTRLQRSGSNLEATIRALFPPASMLVANAPSSLAAVITQATAFAAIDRFANAASMGDALRGVLAQQTAPSGTPPSAFAIGPQLSLTPAVPPTIAATSTIHAPAPLVPAGRGQPRRASGVDKVLSIIAMVAAAVPTAYFDYYISRPVISNSTVVI